MTHDYPYEKEAEQILGDAMQNYHLMIEEYLKLRIKPKPKWLPYLLWQWLLGQILFLDRMQGSPIGEVKRNK